MKRIALIGAEGFVGTSIAKALSSKKQTDLVKVNRQNYELIRNEGTYDILINAAMPSKRFWAQQNPAKDFIETTQKTLKLVNDWNWKKIIQISSISARSQLTTVYGRHKAAAEKLVGYGDNLILRLGPMYGERLNKGVLVDLLEDRTVFVDKDSRYCFAPVDWIGVWIANNLDLSGVMDLGGNQAIRIGEVAEAIRSKSQFQGAIDNQILTEPIAGAPFASGVISFVRKLKENKG